MEIPKFTDINNLLSESDPIGTPEDRFARGGSKFIPKWWLTVLDHTLATLYLAGFIYIINEIGRWLLGTSY